MHLSEGYPWRALPVILALWSPDFPQANTFVFLLATAQFTLINFIIDCVICQIFYESRSKRVYRGENMLEKFLNSIKSKTISVIGMGISNKPLIKLFIENNIDFTLRDLNEKNNLSTDFLNMLSESGAGIVLGKDYLKNIDSDIIFRTPGVLPTEKELQNAVQAGSKITSEMEVFMNLCPAKIIAVTGSDGKTTSSSIIAELLRAEGYRVHLGGNIGKPLLCELDDISEEDFVVLELSSFQLHSINVSPHIALITNVSPNHLDKHISYEDYIDSKKMVFINQKEDDILVLNADDSICMDFAAEAKGELRFFSMKQALGEGCFCTDGTIYCSKNYISKALMPSGSVLLPGNHNIANYMAAFTALRGIVSDETCRKVAQKFKGVKHRLELVRKFNGVSYINDSIASSPSRTIAGLNAVKTKPILIAGGHDKNIPFDKLADVISEKVKALIVTGDTAEKIAAAVKSSIFYRPEKLPVIFAADLETAVLEAKKLATRGDIVLLSPGCSSFDRFNNFAERGELFRELVLSFK